MSRLQILYSKELARQLGKVAVYLPGAPIDVGDIITFPKGKSFLGKAKPLGSFMKVSSLKKLGVSYPKPKFSNTPDTYKFSSDNAVGFNFDINANADLGESDLPSGNSSATINFSSEGAIYFLGIDCDKKQLEDIVSLQNEIVDKGKDLLWKDTFLVTSITIAKKAFIAQSQSKTSQLLIEGNVRGLNTNIASLKANSKLNIKKQKGDIFIKEWSNDVTVFMDLIRFEKETFSENFRGEKVSTKTKYRILFKPVQIEELLSD